MQVVEDPVGVRLRGLEKEKTRETYSRALRRLSLVSGLTPLEMLLEARRDMKQFWVRIKADAMALKPHVRSSAYSAVRNYVHMESFRHTTGSSAHTRLGEALVLIGIRH